MMLKIWLSMRINEGQDMVMDSVEMNYAKLGHTHEINDINNLMSTIEERVNAVLSYINTNYWKTIYPSYPPSSKIRGNMGANYR